MKKPNTPHLNRLRNPWIEEFIPPHGSRVSEMRDMNEVLQNQDSRLFIARYPDNYENRILAGSLDIWMIDDAGGLDDGGRRKILRLGAPRVMFDFNPREICEWLGESDPLKTDQVERSVRWLRQQEREQKAREKAGNEQFVREAVEVFTDECVTARKHSVEFVNFVHEPYGAASCQEASPA